MEQKFRLITQQLFNGNLGEPGLGNHGFGSVLYCKLWRQKQLSVKGKVAAGHTLALPLV
jgi:hypothetical protein